MEHGILATREELAELRERIPLRPFDAYYEALRSRCALILQSSPITEMHWQAAWASGRYNAALTSARAAQGRILDLAIADAFDRNTAYRSRAVEELMNLIRWSTWVDPSRTDRAVDLCTAEAAIAATIGADMLAESLDDAQLRQVHSVLEERMIRPYLQAVRDGAWWYSAVNHWNAVLNAAAGLTAVGLNDSKLTDETLSVAREGLETFFADLGREGGWDEGIGYWGYAVRFVLLFGHAMARLRDDQSVLHHRGMEETGLFPIYFTPNGRPASFGDSATMPTHGALYLLAKYFDRPELVWWLDSNALRHDPTTMDWSRAGLALLCRPNVEAEPPANLEPLKVFRQIGWAAIADRWPEPSFYCALKTGDLATSHAQRDMNSIQLQVDGEMLLVDVGHPLEEGTRYFSGDRGAFYEVQARAHNTITVGEDDHRPDARGEIRDQAEGDDWRWVLADGGQACGDTTQFYRHVLMLLDEKGVGQSLVVIDELDSAGHERVDLFWHTAGQIELDDTARAGTVAGQRAKLHFSLHTPEGCKIVRGSRKLATRRTDRLLRVSGQLTDRMLFVSAFGRRKIGKIAIEPEDKDGLVVQVADRRIELKSAGRHHVLESVARK